MAFTNMFSNHSRRWKSKRSKLKNANFNLFWSVIEYEHNKNSPVHNSDPGENDGLINLLHRVGIEEWGRLQHTVHGGVVTDKRYK